MSGVQRPMSPAKEMFQKIGTTTKNATTRLGTTTKNATTRLFTPPVEEAEDQGVKEVPKDVMTSQQIVHDIEESEKKFRELQGNLSEILISLKEQHQVTLLLNQKRIQTAISFEALVANTPLHKIAGVEKLEELKGEMNKEFVLAPNTERPKFDSLLEKVVEEDEKTEQTEQSPTSSKQASPKSKKSSTRNDYGGRSMFDSDSEEDEEEEEEEEEAREPSEKKGIRVKTIREESTSSARDDHMQPEVQDDASAITGTSFFERVSSIITEVEEMEKATTLKKKTKKSSKKEKKDNKEKKGKSSKKEREDPAPVGEITLDSAFTDKDSFGATTLTCTKLTQLYADNEYTFLIKYVEDWQKVVTERINSLLLAFLDHQDKLIHYREKVDKLTADIDRAYENDRSLSKRKAQKWERNKLKLNGAREAHDSYGESLYLLLEEVTERAWKEFYPVLLRTMKFIVTHAKDEAKVCSRMDKALDELEIIGMEYGIESHGRINTIRTKKPEAFYTGERSFTPSINKYNSFAN